MQIDILDLQDNAAIDKKKIVKCAEFVLNEKGERSSELSILFVDDSYIRRLNRQYRRRDSATDVLAFSMREGLGAQKNTSVLGDVVISIETAKREALKRKRPVQEEMLLYLIHGILHLLGFNDETCRDRKKMKQEEKKLLEGIR